MKRIIEQCYAAGAKRIYVIDHILVPNDNKLNEIAKTAKGCRCRSLSCKLRKVLQESNNPPGAKNLKHTKVHELVINSNVFINVPILWWSKNDLCSKRSYGSS